MNATNPLARSYHMPIEPELLQALENIVGADHVLVGDRAMSHTVDWTGRFRGRTPAVIRPGTSAEIAAVLALCNRFGAPLVPQGGNTGLVGGGVPLRGELVLSMTRLNKIESIDTDTMQVTAESGATLQQIAECHPDFDFPVAIASGQSATVGGSIATNAGGLRVLRFGPMRAQIRGIEAVLSNGSVISHMSGLVKNNTGYDYSTLLAGSEGTLAVITRATLRMVPRIENPVAVLVGIASLSELHTIAMRAAKEVPGLLSAEFFLDTGLQMLVEHTTLEPPLPDRSESYLLLEADGPTALEDLSRLIGELPTAVAESQAERRRLWRYRERHPEAAGFIGLPLKLDVAVPAAQWITFASTVTEVVHAVDREASVILFGHIVDGNVHVNIVPKLEADGRHQDAVFSYVASLGGSISAEHGIGTLKAPWLSLARTSIEQRLFADIRRAFDPAGILNPNVFPR